MYILAPNGTAETYPYSIGQLRKDNPQVSFPRDLSPELLASYGVYPVTRTDRPDYNSITHDLSEGTPALIEGVWTQTWEITAASQEEVDARFASWAAAVRSDRDQKLQETDWIVIKSYERNESIPAEWEVYRQALRDITTQQGFPYEVIWPPKP